MGRLHVDEMLSELTPQEFDEWIASEFAYGPFGDHRLERVLAVLSAAILSALGDTRISPEDVLEVNDLLKQSQASQSGQVHSTALLEWLESIKGK